MDIICKNCGKKINIPDEKIPQGKSFSIRCPSCREKTSVDLRAESEPGRLAEADWSEQQEVHVGRLEDALGPVVVLLVG